MAYVTEYLLVKKLVGRAELRTDRERQQGFALCGQQGAQLGGFQALHIFLGSEYPIIGSGPVEDELEVLGGESMVVRESEQLRLRSELLHMREQVLGMSDSGEHEWGTFVGHRCVLDSGKMELLIGRQMETVVDDAHVDRLHRFRALGDHNTVGFEGPGRDIPKPSPREHMIVYVEPVVRREQDREPAAQRTMLEGVIEDDHIQIGHLSLELVNTPYAVLADSDGDVREGPVHLQCLVSDGLHRGSVIGHEESTRLAFVSARKHRRLVAVVQQELDDVRSHRSLARTTDRQVTHTDCRHRHGEGRQEMLVVQPVPDRDAYTEEGTERYVNE